MTHKEIVIKVLQHKETDRPPFQASFTPEFADRLKKLYNIGRTGYMHDPHNGRWNGYDLEILTGQDALQCSIGWSTNYYLDAKLYR